MTDIAEQTKSLTSTSFLLDSLDKLNPPIDFHLY